MAVLIGLAAGLLYDLLRPPRRSLRSLAAFGLDALFCLMLGAALFLYAMSLGEGRLGIGALAAAWTGFFAWQRLFSPRLLPIFVKLFQYLDIIPRIRKKAKKFFKKMQKRSFKNGKDAL